MVRRDRRKGVVVWLAVLALFAAGAVAAFASGTPDTDASTGAAAAPGADPLAKYAAVEGKQYKIKWVSGASQPTEENAEMVAKWEKQFNVDLQLYYFDQYETQINLLFASGNIPDKFSVLPLQNLPKWIKQDLLAEIPKGLIQKLCPNMYKEMMQLNPNYLDYGKMYGKIYGIRQDNYTFRFRSAMMWNMKWLKNVGFTAMPTTLDDAERAFYKFAREDPDKNGKTDTYAFSKEGLFAIFGSYGIFPGGNKFTNFDHWVERNGKLVNSATAPEMKLALAKLAKWYKDGLIDPEWVTGENRGGTASVSYSFIEQRIGMTNMGTYYHWQPALFKGCYQGMNYTEAYKIFGEEIKDIFGYGGPLSVPGYKSALVSNDEFGGTTSLGKPLEKEPDKMAKILSMIDYFAIYENYLTGNKGIEGKHWQYVDGLASSIGKYVDVVEQSRIGAHNTMIVWLPLVAHSRPEVENALRLGLDKGILKTELKMPLEAQAKYSAELNKMRDQMVLQIVRGERPVEYFDEYVARYNAVGGDQLVSEANAWYESIKQK